MANAYERHDISDESWAKIELLLPGRKGTWGGNARDNRQFINAVFAFLTLKRWRGIATRYAKNTSSSLAAVQISYIAAWVLNY